MIGVQTIRALRQPDGRHGLRQHVLVVPAVACANKVVEHAAAAERVPYIIHPVGCAQVGADLEATAGHLKAMLTHGNVHTSILVSLGCEGLPTDELLRQARGLSGCIAFARIQELGGSRRTEEAVRELIRRAQSERQEVWEEVPAERLAVGVVHGAKADDQALQAVLHDLRTRGVRVQERLAKRDPVAVASALLVEGVHAMVAVGLDQPLGLPVAPVLNLCPAAEVPASLHGDFDALTYDDALLEALLSGSPTLAERQDLWSFVIARKGPTL